MRMMILLILSSIAQEESMPTVRRVAMLVSTGSGYGRGIIRGVSLYVRPVKPWVFHIGPPQVDVVRWLRDWQPDGIIGQLGDVEVVRALRQLDRPLVSVSSSVVDPEVPVVRLDNYAAGAMAAKHLMERGFRNFGYCGDVNRGHSPDRQRGFCDVMAEAGHDCAEYHYQSNTTSGELSGWTWSVADEGLREWLRALPKPAGVLAAQDYLGLILSEVCRQADVRVPEEVALIGVDNDELACELSYPPLSSVRSPTDRIGFEAARLLDRLMEGERAPAEAVLIQPGGVVARQSSDVMATEDPSLVAAIQFIRQHADQPIGVDDVLEAIPISRRALEMRFKSLLGRSPLAEIRRVHVEQAKRMLAETDLTLPSVARASGFNSPERLSVVFTQMTGMTPGTYRRQMQGGRLPKGNGRGANGDRAKHHDYVLRKLS
jgi:LacI family transcriptional regulator